MMRNVVLGMNVSLDGYAAGPNGELDWMFPSIDAELNRSILETLDEIDTFVMGRHTYLGMAAHWPNANDEIATRMNQARKIVFSDTLATVDWENSTLAQTDPALELDQLKRQSGKNIGVAGGARFAQYVSGHGLVDEYRLTIHPVILGAGMRLFAHPLNLTLITTETFNTGAVIHTYRPAQQQAPV
jgi:dihydrofolate reductase